MTDLDKLEAALKVIHCYHYVWRGNDARSMEPVVGPLRNQVSSVITVGPATFWFDEAGKFLGTRTGPPGSYSGSCYEPPLDENGKYPGDHYFPHLKNEGLGEQAVCHGCGRKELHKMCPAWGTPYYMSGITFTKEMEEGRAAEIRRQKQAGEVLEDCSEVNIRSTDAVSEEVLTNLKKQVLAARRDALRTIYDSFSNLSNQMVNDLKRGRGL